MVIATNLNYIFCVYEEKIVKNDSDIIQPTIIDNSSTHS